MDTSVKLTEREIAVIRKARLERIELDIKGLKLSQEYLEAFHANPSRDLPYHGNQHQLAVASLALRGYAASGIIGDKRPAILIAGLFHDYGYLPGAGEEINIARAIAEAQSLTERLNPELTKIVIELIQATEFPHGKASNQSEAILQDADLLMIALPDFSVFLQGLAEENPGFKPDPLFPGESALKTKWGKRVYATASAMHLSGEKIADPVQAALVGNTIHLQKMSSLGFLVDESIADKLEQLWTAGYQTLYSCGGDKDETSPGYDERLLGYVAFTSVSPEQLKALERAADAAETTLEHYERSEGSRKVLRFDYSLTEDVFKALLR